MNNEEESPIVALKRSLDDQRASKVRVLESRLRDVAQGKDAGWACLWVAHDALALSRSLLVGEVNDDEIKALEQLIAQLAHRLEQQRGTDRFLSWADPNH